MLARHAWDDDTRLDLFADEERTIDAIGGFAGAAEAAGYRAFCRDTKRIYDILEKPFLRAPQPSMAGLIGAGGFRGLMRLPQIKPFSSMWSALGQYFSDPRLQQLFGRYATYCGSSPYLAPATLMLVAHVERAGVWSIDGGMHALAEALADGAKSFGATHSLRPGGQRSADRLWSGLRRPTCERRAHRSGRRDRECRCRGGRRRIVRHQCAPWRSGVISPRARSLSAVTWSMVAKTERFPAGPAQRVFLCATTTPNSTTSSATTRCRKSRRSMSARRIAATLDQPRRRGAASGARQCAREWRPAFLRSSGGGAMRAANIPALERCGLQIQRRPETMQVDDAGGFQQAVSGDGRCAVRPQLARMDRVVSASGSANQDTGTVSGGGQHASGSGRADGGAVGPLGGFEPARGPDFARLVHANGYAWWYVDALSDDGQNGITIIAFIGSVFSPYYAFARRKGVGRSAQSLRDQCRDLSQERKSLDDDRAAAWRGQPHGEPLHRRPESDCPGTARR